MPTLGRRSKERLATCHRQLQAVFEEVIKRQDCTIICGYRDKGQQDKAVADGKSKLPWPSSTHNKYPSRGVDAAPYHTDPPHIHWDNQAELTEFGHLVLAVAAEIGVRLRWGGDWDGDGDTTDQAFNDLVHFEMM